MSPSSKGKPQRLSKRRFHPLLKFWNKFLKPSRKKAPASLLRVEETCVESEPTIITKADPELGNHAQDTVHSHEEAAVIGEPAISSEDLPELLSHMEIAGGDSGIDTPEENTISSSPHLLNRLPTEMIREIFLRCLPTNNFIKPSRHCAPILLTQICASWRTIALSDSRLWSSLELTDPRRLMESITFLAEMWLSRAGKAPLNISMHECWRSQGAIIAVLNRFSDQWRHIRLEISELDQSLPISEGPTPNLETFELRTLDIPTEGGVLLVSELPRIRDTIVIPYLRSFVISTNQDIAPLLNALTLPELREVILNMRSDYIAPWSQTAFLSFIDRSDCSIESLNFYFTPLSADDFIVCLQRTQSSLKELTVQTMGRQAGIVTDKVLDLLTYHEDATHMCLCPNLEVLALYSCLDSTEGHVAQMVESRLNPAIPLHNTDSSTQVTRIKVIETYDDEREIPSLKPLRSLGLVLKVYSALDGSPIELEPEDAIRLRMLREQGLILRVYTQATGHFGEME
ncbi:hypothetical protein BD779DRAFT_1796778 [Infundibulicybe gibba]|nr:hypothetical protein BD779DRAFT_1796778 [Infundibulicybe gibba]